MSPVGEVSYPWGFVPPAGQTRGCRDFCAGGTMVPTAFLTAFVLVIITYIVGNKLLSSWRFELSAASRELLRKAYCRSKDISMIAVLPETEQNEEKEFVAKFSALGLIGGPFWAVLGPLTMALAIYMEMTFSYNDPKNFQNDIAMFDEFDLRVHNFAALIGELFLGYTMYMTVMLFMGWDKGVDTLIHHIAFITLAWFQVGYGVFVRVGLWAMSMELSTPALYVHLVYRQIEGETASKLSSCSAIVFGLLFILVRIIGFGYGVITAAVSTITHFDTVLPDKPDAIPKELGLFILLLMFGGWALQLYWATFIFGKLFKKKKPRTTDGTYGTASPESPAPMTQMDA
eukprot:Hpha_TRINITY_DN33550_c0_g1::TRINITY_DN33550_c0_g1_i1::g.171131::m.171131